MRGGVCRTVKRTDLVWHGDFRSKECVKILKEADIIVTNPPFSLFRDFFDLLIKYDKKFLILGPINAVKYNNVFPYLVSNKVYIGYHCGNMYFNTDSDTKNISKLGNICWFTNLDVCKVLNDYSSNITYDPSVHPKYDNYDAIDISKLSNLPNNYDGIMGVPISFLLNYNPNKFKIFGKRDDLYMGDKKLYTRILIQRIA